MNYVILLGICQSLIALLLLPASRQKRPANEWLRWLLACICIHLTLKFLIFTVVDYPGIRREFNTFIGMAYGPLLWIFAQKLRNDRYRPSRHWYVFLPVIAGAFVYLFIAVYTAWYHEEPLALMHRYNQTTEYLSNANMIYPLLCIGIARKLAPFWNIERRLLLQLSVILMFLCSLSFVFGYLVPHFTHADADHLVLTVRIIAYACLVFVCLLIIRYEMSLQRVLGQTMQVAEPELVAVLQVEEEVEAVPENIAAIAEMELEKETPARKPLLDVAQQQVLISRLTQLMETQKPYTDPSLSLEKLAALLKIPRNQASELINHCIGKSFYQYINEYRIREVIVLLDKCTRRDIVPNILSLAFDAGFHSKSSFNLYFKKVTGYTPSAYLKGDHTKVNAAPGFTLLGPNAGAPHYS